MHDTVDLKKDSNLLSKIEALPVSSADRIPLLQDMDSCPLPRSRRDLRSQRDRLEKLAHTAGPQDIGYTRPLCTRRIGLIDAELGRRRDSWRFWCTLALAAIAAVSGVVAAVKAISGP